MCHYLVKVRGYDAMDFLPDIFYSQFHFNTPTWYLLLFFLHHRRTAGWRFLFTFSPFPVPFSPTSPRFASPALVHWYLILNLPFPLSYLRSGANKTTHPVCPFMYLSIYTGCFFDFCLDFNLGALFVSLSSPVLLIPSFSSAMLCVTFAVLVAFESWACYFLFLHCLGGSFLCSLFPW